MNIIKKAAARSKKFLDDHKVAIAVTSTVIVMAKVSKHALREHEEFMAEHGILELYYTPGQGKEA